MRSNIIFCVQVSAFVCLKHLNIYLWGCGSPLMTNVHPRVDVIIKYIAGGQRQKLI